MFSIVTEIFNAMTGSGGKPDAPAPALLTAAEQTLQDWGFAYKKQPDGRLLVQDHFNISGRNLGTLPDLSSVIVEGDVQCSHNQLKSLKGAPASVSGTFYCDHNELATLEHAPQNARLIKSDLGEFPSWNAVPEHLKMSAETRERLAQQAEQKKQEQRERLEQAVQDNTTLGAPLSIMGPLRFKRRAVFLTA